MNILFTCAGRRTYLLRYFKEQLAGDGLIVGADLQLSAPALTAADVKLQVPRVYDPSYIDCILKICRDYSISLLVSLNDLELPILAREKACFEEVGTRLLLSSPEVIDICFDKYRTANFLRENGLPVPPTYVSLADAVSALEGGDITFPLVIKPRWGSGSIGIEYVKCMEELAETYAALHKKVKETILADASVGDDYILIQQKLCGQEYGLDIMNDFEGRNHGVSVKRKLAMRAGETDKACTVDNPALRRMGTEIASALHHVGNLDVDVMEHDGCLYVLEMNPRFGGGFPFSYEAGVNFPLAIIKWLRGEQVDDDILVPQYGRTFAKCDYLVDVG